jgi:hypothetical protein
MASERKLMPYRRRCQPERFAAKITKDCRSDGDFFRIFVEQIAEQQALDCWAFRWTISWGQVICDGLIERFHRARFGDTEELFENLAFSMGFGPGEWGGKYISSAKELQQVNAALRQMSQAQGRAKNNNCALEFRGGL